MLDDANDHMMCLWREGFAAVVNADFKRSTGLPTAGNDDEVI